MPKPNRNPLVSAFRACTVVSLVAMVAIVFANVVLRYGFNSGFTAGEEFARYLFVWICALGAIAAYGEGRHIGVDLIVSKLRGMPLAVFKAIGTAIELIVFSLVFWGGIEYFLTSASSPGPATGIPFGFVAVSVCVTSGAILAILVIRIIKALSAASRSSQGA